MLEFCGRHKVAPLVEENNMSDVNDAIDRLKNGSPRYRLVLKNDLQGSTNASQWMVVFPVRPY
jgi:uncharacterized zinc-type alcohol dehydrogenase-like protein